MRAPISSVVKWAVSRMTPRPRASAASRFSRPSIVTIRRNRSGDAHQVKAVSNRPMPRLAKCRASSSSRSAAFRCGRHNSMFLRAVRVKGSCSRYIRAPRPVPIRISHANGSVANVRNRPSPSHVGQYRGANSRMGITGLLRVREYLTSLAYSLDPIHCWNCESMRRSGTSDARHVEVRLKHLALVRQGRVVLDDVSWTVKAGQRWVLAGGNGAGKTQLLKIIAGAVWPTPADTKSPSAVANSSRRYRWRGETFPSPFEVKEEIGYVGPERQDKYERYGWNHPVEQIVGTGLYRTDIPLNPLSVADRRRIAALLARLAIAPLAGRPFLSLSYGERRLTLLARVLASQPKVLLLDELLNGLDETNHERALRWLCDTKRSG